MNYLVSLLPVILPLAGSFLKGRDTNTTGGDDVFGDILIATSPVVSDLISSKDNPGKVRKAVVAIRSICDSYLALNTPPVV